MTTREEFRKNITASFVKAQRQLAAQMPTAAAIPANMGDLMGTALVISDELYSLAKEASDTCNGLAGIIEVLTNKLEDAEQRISDLEKLVNRLDDRLDNVVTEEGYFREQ